ncbi:chorismate mutase [Actinokineospora sp. 24-640]
MTVLRTTVRAVRGAIQVDRDEPDVLIADTATLVTEVLTRNAVSDPDEIISILFTMTPDLRAGFPAAAVRGLGLADVPVMCATELAVPDGLPRVIRLLAHIHTDLAQAEVAHVYLRGAAVLRPDLAARWSGTAAEERNRAHGHRDVA